MSREAFRSEADLLASVRNDDIELLKSALDRGADIDFCFDGEQSETALSLAAGRGQYAIAKYLIDAGADVNRPGRNTTPLVMAVLQEHPDIVALLLEHGADINAVDEDGYSYTVIEIADAYGGRLPMIRLMAEAGGTSSKTLLEARFVLDAVERFRAQDEEGVLGIFEPDDTRKERVRLFLDRLIERAQVCAPEFLDRYAALAPEIADQVAARRIKEVVASSGDAPVSRRRANATTL